MKEFESSFSETKLLHIDFVFIDQFSKSIGSINVWKIQIIQLFEKDSFWLKIVCLENLSFQLKIDK